MGALWQLFSSDWSFHSGASKYASLPSPYLMNGPLDADEHIG